MIFHIHFRLFERAFAEAYNNLAVAQAELGHYRNAVESLRRAIQLKPDFAMSYFNLGRVFVLLKDKSAALEQYKILNAFAPDLATKLHDEIYQGKLLRVRNN